MRSTARAAATDDVPLVAVGGGSFLVPGPPAGRQRGPAPDHHDVANAVGAAIAQVSGQMEEVVHAGRRPRGEAGGGA